MNSFPNIKIGCSGFYNAHWRKIFYPESLPKNQWLDFYSQNLNSIEINSTFYKYPTPSTLNNWYQKTPKDFLFSIKAPKLITHLNRFTDCEDLINDFYKLCEQGIKDKLGCLLFQLPPTIVYTPEKLEQIVKCLKPGFTNVIEFRHTSWWNNEVYKILTENNILFCSVNHPKMPNTIIINSDKVYIRLHGNPEMFYSSYSTEFLTKLCKFILPKKELKEAFIYFNNTAGNAGILNALELQKIFLKISSDGVNHE